MKKEGNLSNSTILIELVPKSKCLAQSVLSQTISAAVGLCVLQRATFNADSKVLPTPYLVFRIVKGCVMITDS